MARSMRNGAAAERGRGRGEQDGGRRDEAAAEADDGDQRGEAAEDQDDRLGIDAFARRQFAAQRQSTRLPIASSARPVATT